MGGNHCPEIMACNSGMRFCNDVQSPAVRGAQRKCLVVIPARGGSKGIPRKNLRLLDGKPLLAHVIDAACQVPSACVLVSTEDDEIAELATDYGIGVVRRPLQLADDAATLDDVVLHAWREYETSTGEAVQVVVTVQPTSPLVSPKTILDVINKLEREGLDCCLTVTDARHLYWTERDGMPIPVYSKRENRQWLPPFWRETGAVVATRRALLLDGRRIGGRVGLFVMPEDEAVDIDSWDDWVVAESRLTSPKVVIRVTGNRTTGLGHAYRALSLARRLFSPQLLVAVNHDSDLAAELIARENYRVMRVQDDDEFIRLVQEGGYDLVVNDILDTDRRYVEELKRDGKCVVVNFEDLGPGAAVADLTINALYEYSTPLPNQRYGWQYVCLRDEFLSIGPADDWGKDRALLITFGGTDPNDLTAMAIRAAATAADRVGGIRLMVVVGIGNPRHEAYQRQLEREARTLDFEIDVNVCRMSRLMRRATLAVTSNGRTVFELAAMGVPMVTMSQNRRETTHTFSRLCGGAIDLGLATTVDETELAQVLEQLFSDSEKLRAMRANLLRYDLRGGTARVVQEIMATYRQWRINREFTSQRTGVGADA